MWPVVNNTLEPLEQYTESAYKPGQEYANMPHCLVHMG